MPVATIRGASINYAVLGDKGPWVALSPGGRAGMKGVRSFADTMAAAGYRVLLHDRRNCGESHLALGGDDSEYEIWADDLYELLKRLDATPAIVGGNSAGCRLSVVFGIRHPEAVSALILWRLSGGEAAARRLAQKYYGEFIDAARSGGMAAVCETEFFADRFKRRPRDREGVLALDPKTFIADMARWREGFLKGADQPIIGASPEELRRITAPVCIIPGNDKTHTKANARAVLDLLPQAELHEVIEEEVDQETLPIEEWRKKEAEQFGIFVDFLRRKGLAPSS